MAKKPKRTTKSKSKKRKSKRAKHSTPQSETAIQVVDAEVVETIDTPTRFNTPVQIRVEAIALSIMGIPTTQIAERLQISPVTATRIIKEAPEVEGITRAMQTAGTIELVKAIPEAVESLRNQIKAGDGGLALAMLRGLQLLNPRAEIVASAKDGEFDDWTVGELTLFLETGEKPKGK